jgi:hypothetical protein
MQRLGEVGGKTEFREAPSAPPVATITPARQRPAFDAIVEIVSVRVRGPAFRKP